MLLGFYNYRVFYCGMSVVIIKNDDTATAMTAKYREVKFQINLRSVWMAIEGKT